MNKRGQLVHIFEIVGTIFVIFLMCFIAQAYGSGENFYKYYIAKDLALTADAFFINPGEEISTDYLVEAEEFGYKISFTGNNENSDFVKVQGGKLVENKMAFFHLENVVSDQSYPFISKDHQSFTAGFSFDSPKMLVFRHSDKLEVTKKEVE